MAPLPDLGRRFPEPVVDSGADPYVVLFEGSFYYSFSSNASGPEAIYISKSPTLDAIGKGEATAIWQPPAGHDYSQNLWAPELHRADGTWYVYFAAGRTSTRFFGQRMYVLQADGPDPFTARYRLKGPVGGMSDHYAIDGTILELADKSRYFVWSGREDDRNPSQNLYIAAMVNPWTVAGPRVKIASPILEWEKRGVALNEGPQVLPQGAQRHIIYSAAGSDTDHYCLGQLSLVGDDPLDPTHWMKRPEPVFESHAGLIAPGHASFILTPDERSGWMIFHTARHPGSSWDRQVRLAAFALGDNGALTFMPTLSQPLAAYEA